MNSPPSVAVREIHAHEGKEVTLKGWLYHKRSSGKILFLQVRDGTDIIQCVFAKGEVSDLEFEEADRLTQESSVIVTGVVRADKRSPIGYEISGKTLRLISASAPYPIAPKDHGVGFLMEHRHLWLRSRRQHAALRVRSELIQAIRGYFEKNGFVMLDAPIFTPAACEGTTTLFETDYFGEKVFLTQSGQLYMEAGAMAFGKVFCFGPTFRAEKSKTRRHLTEFWMIEPEVAFNDLNANMLLAEDMLVDIVARVLDRCRPEFAILERDTKFLENVQKPFPRITYNEAVEVLNRAGATSVKWGDDFGGDEETLLTKQFDRPVMVHRYPLANKAFYMKGDPDDPKLSLSVDVLAPEGYGEIVGGGQREDSLEVLEKKIEEHRLPKAPFEWYLDLRRFGSVPHAGFGLGLERTVAWVCGLHHVRETIPFPRMLERVTP